jgi:RIO kinase 1
MDLITDDEGHAAPRLSEVDFTPEVARAYHALILADIVRMLCAGLIHGDLSEFNVLIDAQGPVIIDLPQAVNAAGNNSAAMMLERDVQNMARYFGQFAPELLETNYGKEIWEIYESGRLHPEINLTGQSKRAVKKADVNSVMSVIDHALKEELARVARLQAAKED